MTIAFAVDRLYQAGWRPSASNSLPTLPDGRCYPTVDHVTAEFAASSFTLTIKKNPTFNCASATWEEGTAIGTSEAEAAVFALAQMLEARHLVTA